MALPPFLAPLERNDPDFAKVIEQVTSSAMGPGALDRKTKLLLALALDAAKGSVHGVASLSQQLRALGASDAEIAEALRIAYSTMGNAILITSAAAFPER